MEIYVIVSYYYDGSGAPDIDFATTADEAINITAKKSDVGKFVSVFKVSNDGSSLITGKDLRTIGENNDFKK